ncbi:MAG: iolC [Deltaproteobacteria bacterium]|nr:iolC [Deltaproteobacteria bacterium]
MGDAVVIWGEVLWDRFPDGAQLGGAPANVAWHLAQAGGWAQLVTRVGDDEDGRLAIDRLAELVDTDLVQVDPVRATGEVTVRLERGEPRYTLQPGRAWEHIACTEAVKRALSQAGVFVFGTLAQRTPDGLREWREAAHAATRCLRACDVNLRPMDVLAPSITEALAVANLVKVNDRELATLRDWFGWSDPIAMLRERARVVAVTHGAAGSTLFGETGAIEIAATAAVPGGDNVGCGDAYLAILVHGLTSGWDLAASGRAASRWSAAVAGVRGATPTFSDEQIADLLELG